MSAPDASSSQSRRASLQNLGLTIFDRLFNVMFNMTHNAGRIRLVAILGFGFITWLMFALFSHPFQAWRQAGLSGAERANPLALLVQILFAPDVIGHVLAIILPFWVAWQLAAVFLDDIFELNDIKTSRNFLSQAAFTLPPFRVMRVENGEVRKADQRLPIFKIGGPGRVSVSLDSVAVFEKVNGEPEIIGPTRADQGYSRNLDGFERLRNIIDIRDRSIPIEEMTGRTKDGIPITVRNIRLVCSVQRDPRPPTTTGASGIPAPFTYTDVAILALTYDQFPGEWYNAVTSLVKGELVQFISQHTLGEIFANAGEPETARSRQALGVVERLRSRHRARLRRYRMINISRREAGAVPQTAPRKQRRFPLRMYTGARQSEKMSWELYPIARRIHLAGRWNQPHGMLTTLKKYPPLRPRGWRRPVALPFRVKKFAPRPRFALQYRPETRTALPFVPRPELSRSFYQQFARDFSTRASARGIRLEWIDVGVWHTSADLIIEQHRDAWLLTTDNNLRSNEASLSILQSQSRTTEMLRLIRQPIYCYWDLTRKNTPREEVVRQLIEEYLGALRTARDDLRERELPVPDTLQPAIEHIQRYQRNTAQSKGEGRFI